VGSNGSYTRSGYVPPDADARDPDAGMSPSRTG
jgi:hypothetical protein